LPVLSTPNIPIPDP